jgi:hypothetical protein
VGTVHPHRPSKCYLGCKAYKLVTFGPNLLYLTSDAIAKAVLPHYLAAMSLARRWDRDSTLGTRNLARQIPRGSSVSLTWQTGPKTGGEID